MRFLIFALFSAFCFSPISAQEIDTDQSSVQFSVSNMGFRTVEGTFSGMQGDILFDGSDLDASKINVCIDASSVHTGNKSRDKHLRNKDFFDVSNYPKICINSNSIQKTKEGYLLNGTLSLHGIEKKINIPFAHSNNTFTGKFTMNRLDYGIGPKGGFMIGKEIEVNISSTVQ